MNTKITKLRADNARDRKKISALQAKCKERDRQIREMENTDIVGMVRAQGLTLEQFAELLQTLGAPVPTKNTPEKEASAHEET